MAAILTKVVVFIMYVGSKLQKPDTTRANTGLIWYGNGFVNLVDEDAALILMQHPDVWKPVEKDGVEIPGRVVAAYEANYRRLFGRAPDLEGLILKPSAPAPAPVPQTLSALDAGLATSQPVPPVEGDEESKGEVPDEINFDEFDPNLESDGRVHDDESPRVQAIRAALVSLDVMSPKNRNPDFFNGDGSPKVTKVRELMNDDGVSREEVQSVFKQLMSEITPV